MSLKKRLEKTLKTKPRDFQIHGMRFLKSTRGKGIIADDMGVGKTLQVLGWISVNPSKRPIIIITPANAKYNWEEQIKEHTYLKCEVLSGRTPYKTEESILIINYDVIHWWKKDLKKIEPQIIVMDECHYIKNTKAKRTKACKYLAKYSNCVIPMSGTPIENRPLEFFPVLNMVAPEEFKSFWKYVFRYCGAKRSKWHPGWDFTGATNLKELKEKIKPFFIRRMKSEVLKELPEKQRTILPVEINNKKEYKMATVNFLHWYRKTAGRKKANKAKKAQSLVKIGQLKRLVAKGKLKSAYEWIDNFLEETNEKLVVFVYHREIFDSIKKKYKKISAVGGKSGKERQEQVKKFQNNKKYRIFIGTIKADKESITLTAASTVLFLELGWKPSEHDQAEDRINRIGQRDNKIQIYYILGKNTVDQYVWDIIEKKRKIIDQILNGKDVRDNFNISNVVNFLKRNKK